MKLNFQENIMYLIQKKKSKEKLKKQKTQKYNKLKYSISTKTKDISRQDKIFLL